MATQLGTPEHVDELAGAALGALEEAGASVPASDISAQLDLDAERASMLMDMLALQGRVHRDATYMCASCSHAQHVATGSIAPPQMKCPKCGAAAVLDTATARYRRA